MNQREKRLADHEPLLLQYLEKARAAADDAYGLRDEYREKMRAAYRGRERALRFLDKVTDLHALKGDGSCSCGVKRGCRTGALMQDKWVLRELAKLEQRDRAAAAELGIADGPSRDDEWLVREWDRLDGPTERRWPGERPPRRRLA